MQRWALLSLFQLLVWCCAASERAAEASAPSHAQPQWDRWLEQVLEAKNAGHKAQASDRLARGMLGPSAPYADRYLLSLRAELLVDQRCYLSAQAVLKQLAEQYPHSALASADHPLVQRIAALMQQTVGPQHIAWYDQAALGAMGQAQAGLACDYLWEAVLLALAAPPDPTNTEQTQRLLLLATWYAKLGNAARGRELLQRFQLLTPGIERTLTDLSAASLRLTGTTKRP